MFLVLPSCLHELRHAATDSTRHPPQFAKHLRHGSFVEGSHQVYLTNSAHGTGALPTAECPGCKGVLAMLAVG